MEMNHFLKNYTSYVAGSKTRWLTLIVWMVLIGLVSVIWPAVNEHETNTSNLLPEDAMSVVADQIIEEQFSDDVGIPLLLVWYQESGLTEENFQLIQSLYMDLEVNPLQEQSMVPPFGQLPIDVLRNAASEDEKAITTPVFFNRDASVDELKEALSVLEEKVGSLTGTELLHIDLAEEGLHLRFSGPVGISIDATELFSQADFTLLIATVLLVLILLILLYRSPILAIVPLIGVGFAFGIISPLLGFLAREGWIVVDAQAISIMTVLLFGAGTDYCLFLISRYRDELQLEENKYKALQLALANSGGAIMMSGLTTMIGLLSLGLANYASYDRFAVPFSLAILVMAIAVVTLLPSLLALIGRVAFFPFIPRTERMIVELEKKKGKPVRKPKMRSAFSKMTGRLVTEKPWRIIIVTMILLVSLAAVVPRIEYSYGLLDSFPEDMPSREGFSIIAEHYPAGEIAPIQVLVDTKGNEVDLQDTLLALEAVENVSEPVLGEKNKEIQKYEVKVQMDPYSSQAIEEIPLIKQVVEDALNGAGVNRASENVWIGGETAELYDTKVITNADQNRIIPVILIIMAILLVIYLRSVVAMAYLLFTVVLSFFSALGLGWLIIHYGLAPAMQGLIPLYTFVFLVALGGDYNIFMISSIWKKSKTMPYKKAIATGVEGTSSVISSAGLILAGTFAVLAVMPIQVLVQFGIVTAVGILMDTFIVRPLLVPAITTVLGKYAFWPGVLWKKEKKDSKSKEYS
ncbi:membrane protein [Halalkalibacter wakoensis JCM 9140]|uniref:Membrane protein n=1 Tax=Halalkalibacter wakoensis JCM 9140 TaxID=1236970 RepID=W4Q1I6_9BACI|nr:membrane protein [Halalkalibacter wakoensis JCM 9140]